MFGLELEVKPFEVELYKRKQVRRGGDPDRYVEAIKISPAEGQCLTPVRSHDGFLTGNVQNSPSVSQ